MSTNSMLLMGVLGAIAVPASGVPAAGGRTPAGAAGGPPGVHPATLVEPRLRFFTRWLKGCTTWVKASLLEPANTWAGV